MSKMQEVFIHEVFIQLLSEVPPDTIMWRILDGEPPRKASDLIQEIRANSELGNEYISDILRISRDLLSRQAKK